jgi:hypothetical protein
MSRAEALTRAEHARAYLLVADLVRDDSSIGARANILGSIAVLAGIAASDAICGMALGKRSVGGAHAEAVDLLRRATPPQSKAASALGRLLASKTDTQYSAQLVSSAKARDLFRAAEQLVGEMEGLLRGPGLH